MSVLRAAFSGHAPYRKLLILVGLILIGSVTFTLVGGLLCSLIYGLPILTDPLLMTDLSRPGLVSALKLMQFVSATGTFLLPPVVAAWLFSDRPGRYLGLDTSPGWVTTGLGFVVIMAAVPLINLLVVWNQGLHLPASMSGIESWMKNAEKQAEVLTNAFIRTPSFSAMMANLLVMALLPAVSEEILFRGLIQKLLTGLSRNTHAAIWLTAFIFSAIHMQFFGFIPRMLLGVLLGYLYIWSQSLWLPIFVHFVNNAGAVATAWYAQRTDAAWDEDTLGTNPGEEPWLIASVIILASCLWLFWRNRRTPSELSSNGNEI